MQLRSQLTDREAYRDALDAELERNAREVAELARSARELAQRQDEQRALVQQVNDRLGQTQSDLVAARAVLAELLRSAYGVGPGDRLRLLLNQQDAARAGRQLGYYRAVARQRAARAAEAQRLAAELTRLRRTLQRESERLAALAAQQEQTRLALESARTARRAVLADIEAAIADDRERVAELDANAAALRRLVEELRQRARIADEIELNQEAITGRRGKLPLPITDARLTRAFVGGSRPGDLHADGVLFSAAVGSEVFPVHHGQVVYADWLRGFGLLLVIDHGDGYMSFYGHNQLLLKEVGEWVGPDDVVALSGSSPGTVAGSGDSDSDSDSGTLYFALRRNGSPLDPTPWFAGGRG